MSERGVEAIEPKLRTLRRAALRWELAASSNADGRVRAQCGEWLVAAAKDWFRASGRADAWTQPGDTDYVDLGDGRVLVLDCTLTATPAAYVVRPIAAGSLAARPAAETAETAERIRQQIRDARTLEGVIRRTKEQMAEMVAPLRPEGAAQPIQAPAGTFTAGTTATSPSPLRAESLADQVERVKVQQEQRTTHRNLAVQLTTAAPVTVALTAVLGFIFADPNEMPEDRIEPVHTLLLKLADRERRQADAELLERMAALRPKLEEALP